MEDVLPHLYVVIQQLFLNKTVKDKIASAIQNSNIKITQLEDNNQDYNNPAHR